VGFGGLEGRRSGLVVAGLLSGNAHCDSSSFNLYLGLRSYAGNNIRASLHISGKDHGNGENAAVLYLHVTFLPAFL
jgi:hypothetical protein